MKKQNQKHMDKTIRINLWSGPRNISTALMYSFAQRTDTTVFDEPLYAYYLANSKAKEYHPGSAEILKAMENDGDKVVKKMEGSHSSPIVFFKHMTHHLLDLDTEIEPYDVNLNHVSATELKAWSAKVLEQLKEKGCDLEKDYFYLLTNETYRRHLVMEIKQYEVPFYIE